MIKQTLLGRLLCRLGLHLLVSRTIDNGNVGSIVGGCVRCDRSFQWDF